MPPHERLVALYLRHGYAADPAFREALDALYDAHRPALAELARRGIDLFPSHFCAPALDTSLGISVRAADSIGVIGAFAGTWKLHAFREGNDTLCAWLMARQKTGRTTPVRVQGEDGTATLEYRYDDRLTDSVARYREDVTLRDLLTGVIDPADAMEKDGSGEPVQVPAVSASDFADYAPTTFLPEPDIEYDADEMFPVVRLDGLRIGTCAPELETVAEVKDRLTPLIPRPKRAALRAEIERIYAAFDAIGYETPDTATRLPVHMHWLYRRVVYGDRCAEIAAHEVPPVDEPTVRTPTDKYATVLGVSQEYLHAHP